MYFMFELRFQSVPYVLRVIEETMKAGLRFRFPEAECFRSVGFITASHLWYTGVSKCLSYANLDSLFQPSNPGVVYGARAIL